jgi:UDP-N-acetylmuramoyl-tripeptide--D-alanyl-D-alanine ligase
MIPLSLTEIIESTQGTLINKTAHIQRIKGFSTDSRTLKKGDVFIALKGPSFDGHKFINTVIQRGAAAIIVSQRPKNISRNVPLIKVPDTLKALGQIAAYYRSKIHIPIIAVTGSNGKTTTKEMIYHILSGKQTGIRSEKSFNNFIGVPLTLLAIRPHHQFAVLELGTNHRGEIDYLARMVRPDIGIITNVSATHLSGLGSISGVAREKRSLFKHLNAHGTALFNLDNPWLKETPQYAEYKIVTFGTSPKARFYGTGFRTNHKSITFTVNNKLICRLPITGRWNMDNALTALAAASAAGTQLSDSIKRLNTFQLPSMRMEQQCVRGARFINDAYNANPLSVTLALDEINQRPSSNRKIMVLGDMGELGTTSSRLHAELGDKIKSTGINVLITVGQEVKATITRIKQLKAPQTLFHFDSSVEAGDFLKTYIRKGDLVLLKGSRALELEKIITQVKCSTI